MKRSPLAKVSTAPISLVQRKLWEECKRIIRAKYGNTCYTCGKRGLEGSDWHTGHMWPKAALGAALKYDLRILRPQCYDCNINKGGMGAVFYARMLREQGAEWMAELERERMEDSKALTRAHDFYRGLLIEYSAIKLSPVSLSPYSDSSVYDDGGELIT